MPPRKPTELKKNQGTYRADRGFEDEPEAPDDEPVMPDDLDKWGQDLWAVATSKLRKMGMLSSSYQTMLELTCYTYSQFMLAKQVVDEQGITYKTITATGETIIRRRPEQIICKEMLQLLSSFLVKFVISNYYNSRVSTV